MTQNNLDLKNKKILYQLDSNSRQPNTQIAKKVGLSKDIVNYRIKQLEREGYIKSYYSIINFYKLGYSSIRVYLKLISCPLSKEKEIIDFLVNNQKVFYVIKIDGDYDIGFGTYVKNIYDFEKFYIEFKKNFKKFIKNDEISIFTKAYHFHRGYILDKKEDKFDYEVIGEEYNLEKVDDLDIKILKLIAKNARIPIIEIANKIKQPVMTVAFRIKQLEKKGVIQGYRFNFDFSKVDYGYYKVDLILDDISRLKDLINYCHIHPNIIYVDQTLGRSDFEFDLEVKNKEEFLKIIDDLKEKFPEIREWKYFTAREYKKLLYYPEE
ncbi:MAG: winged helix-turn-helix transcriptional regulator [Candidatus Nanoarchaeia archaeon]|nr:winged helix-turn-helix transcriptional regulator [Candidatus Nanoarchaeia archaeon]MDD5587906.1 winged helix-turn-helix transcriptional regulator [Candidatus Nanoarchaeia archaeon]